MDSLTYGDLLPQPAEARVTLRNKEYIICSDHPENNSTNLIKKGIISRLQVAAAFSEHLFP